MVRTKKCTGPCQRVLPLDKFAKRTAARDGLQYRCKDCSQAQCKKYTIDKRDQIAARIRFVRFGITPAQYDEMLAAQGGGCALCGTTEPGSGARYFAVDHDHGCCPTHKQSCGKCVRKLLCFRCNTLLGLAEDNADLFESAMKYLAECRHKPRPNQLGAAIVDRVRPRGGAFKLTRPMVTTA